MIYAVRVIKKWNFIYWLSLESDEYCLNINIADALLFANVVSAEHAIEHVIECTKLKWFEQINTFEIVELKLDVGACVESYTIKME